VGCFSVPHELVDDSDPDTDLDQFQHLLQTSEAIRADGHPDWMVLRVIPRYGQGTVFVWRAAMGGCRDTFPVGCAWSDKIVYPEYFANNSDIGDERYQTKHGIYSEGCGLRNVHLSWGMTSMSITC